MLRAHLIAAASATVLLAGCSGEFTKQDSGMVLGALAGGILGNQVGGGAGKVAATAIGAFVGGVVGSEIGKSMDEQDRFLAQQAEFDALDKGKSGVPRKWVNPDNGRYGEVIPGKPFKRAGADCRDYTHKIYIDGQPQALKGTACRNPDGTWSNIT